MLSILLDRLPRCNEEPPILSAARMIVKWIRPHTVVASTKASNRATGVSFDSNYNTYDTRDQIYSIYQKVKSYLEATRKFLAHADCRADFRNYVVLQYGAPIQICRLTEGVRVAVRNLRERLISTCSCKPR